MLAQIPCVFSIECVSVIAVAAGGPAEIVFKALRIFGMRKFVCGGKAVIPGKFFLRSMLTSWELLLNEGLSANKCCVKFPSSARVCLALLFGP